MSSKQIHFIGAGGVGMAALAFLAKSRGDNVTGCDAYASQRTKWLESQGIPVSIGHSPNHIVDADEVVVTPAVSKTNPEFVSAYNRAAKGELKLSYRGEVLAQIVSSRQSIAVAGSHGKTTTSTFIARLLAALGEHVVWAIGGESGDFPVAGSANGPSDGGVLVVEADESDGTLALYAPTLLVITNCEYDHPDHFKTFDEYLACYNTAKSRAKKVIEAEALDLAPFEKRDDFAFLLELPLHNRKNARTAIEVALQRGHSLEAIACALKDIVSILPDRRFQQIYPIPRSSAIALATADSPLVRHSFSDGGFPIPHSPTVIVDYAHHPTEMKCAIQMARERTKGRLRVLFQPHRYSRTKALLADFPSAFEQADEVVLCPTYAAFESPIEGGDIADLYAQCRAKISTKLMLAYSCLEAWRHAFLESNQDDIILLLGAGDIIKLVPNVLEDCSRGKAVGTKVELSKFSFFRTGGCSVGGGAVHIVGMGSNTWISDLTTDTEYKRVYDSTLSLTAKPCGNVVVSAAMCGAKLGVPWMAGVPGTVGGWVKMNAGAFGHSISELVYRVKVDGEWVDAINCGFDYRTSSINGLIEEVEFLPLTFADSESSSDYLSRRKVFPPRSCGSVFKNPKGDFAGRLLEECGVKGLRIGGAYVWQEHANVIAVDDGALSSDILALARIMRERVRYKFGIELESEIKGLVF